MEKTKTGRAWAWEIAGEIGKELCFWAEVSKEQLIRRSKPSPEAKPVLVRLIKESDYRRIMKVLKKQKT